MATDLIVRNMLIEDLADLLRIQKDAYPPELNESYGIFAKRLLSCSATAWVAELSQSVCGYLMGYRSRLGVITNLSDNFEPYDAGDTLYLHDLALAAEARGKKVAQRLLGQAQDFASHNGCSHMALVSVQNTVGFWQKNGFDVVSRLSPEQEAALTTYSGDAVYMIRRL